MVLFLTLLAELERERERFDALSVDSIVVVKVGKKINFSTFRCGVVRCPRSHISLTLRGPFVIPDVHIWAKAGNFVNNNQIVLNMD